MILNHPLARMAFISALLCAVETPSPASEFHDLSGEPAPGDTYSIQIPEDRLAFTSPYAGGRDGRVADGATDFDQIEFSLSTWAPRNLSFPSFITGTSDFVPDSLPAFSVNLFWPRRQWANIDPEIGFTFLQMSRSGTLHYSGVQETVTQALFLVPVRIGARLSPAALQWRQLSPYMSAALLPTFSISSRSPLHDGGPSIGLPVEFSLGAEIGIPRFSALGGGSRTSLNLGAVSTLGSLNSGDFFGIGFLLGLKIRT